MLQYLVKRESLKNGNIIFQKFLRQISLLIESYLPIRSSYVSYFGIHWMYG